MRRREHAAASAAQLLDGRGGGVVSPARLTVDLDGCGADVNDDVQAPPQEETVKLEGPMARVLERCYDAYLRIETLKTETNEELKAKLRDAGRPHSHKTKEEMAIEVARNE